MKSFKLVFGLILVMVALTAAKEIKTYKSIGPQCPGEVVAAFVTDPKANN